MKKLLLSLTLLCTLILSAQNETMYFMKDGEIVRQFNVNTEVDSLVFDEPAPIPVTNITLTTTTATVYAGETIDLSSYISSITPNNATNQSVIWSTNNSSSVNINNTATGSAVAGAGDTSAIVTITANDGSGVSASLAITVSTEVPNPYYTEGAIPNAVYIGRWVKKDVLGTMYDHSFHNGSMIKVNFTGTTAALNFGPSSNFAVKIDDGEWTEYSTGFSASLVTLTPPGGLSAGEHTLEIVAFTTSGITNGNSFIRSTTLELDAGAETRPPNINNKHIEFIGDSISTLGYEDQVFGQHWNWLIGEGTGWEHTHIAMPGINIDQMTQFYVQEFASQNASYFHDPNPAYDFADYTPDAVVVNLGQNMGANQSQYETMFNLLRDKYPDAKIFGVGLFYFRSGGNRSPYAVECENAVNALRNAGDTNIFFLGEAEDTASTHPTPAQSATISSLLLPVIQANLGL